MRVELAQIGKKFDRNWIFRNINASFTSPGIYGLVGYNGSGKSTLLQIISGFVTPSEGAISFKGGNLAVEDVFNHVAFAVPYMELPGEFTITEAIQLQEKFKPFRPNWNVNTILKDIDLSTHADKTLNQLSSGMRQRLKLALAICSESSLLLLDEPCANLDARWTAWFNERLATESGDRLIIISSNSQEAELKLVNQTTLNVSDHHS